MRLPLLASLRAHDAGARRDDLLAGVITAILLIPQGMAYAMLAGLLAQMGLYASVIPMMVYALLGSSRTLSVGPVAVAALMVASALAAFADGDSQRWSQGAIILAAETGLILMLMRLLGLGQLVNFISHPVLSGFTSGAALLIILSQLGHLLGLAIPRGNPWEIGQHLTAHYALTNPSTLVCSALAIGGLLLGRSPLIKLLRRLGWTPHSASTLSRLIPLALVLLASFIAAYNHAHSQYGVAVVGKIPSGLPWPSLNFVAYQGWAALLPSALLIALVAFVESISVAKVLAAKRKQRIDPNQELGALAMTNLAAACAGSMPVAGGFSRSVVNFEAGAQTQVASLVTALVVALVALFFTAWLEHLPQAVLSAIIVVAVAQLIDLKAAKDIFTYDRRDGWTLVTTLLGVLILGIEAGLVAGIVLALALYLKRSSQPHMAVVGRVPGTEHFRNIERHAVDCNEQVLSIRVDENLYFANIAAVENYIQQQLAQRPSIRAVILVMSAVNYIDSSAQEQLALLDESLLTRGITLHMAEVKGPVMDALARSDWGLALRPRIHLSTHIALQQCLSEAQVNPPKQPI